VRLRVPAGALRLVAEPEGAGEVDHLHAGIDEHRRELGGRLLGQREEDEIRLARERRRIERRDFALEEMCERGQFTRRRGPRRGRRRDRDRRMPREKAEQFLARVSSGAGDGHTDGFRCASV
jgi:hypothetical protein